ncbi:G-protein coupled receptor 157-like [Tubulanus polymorphus]|uniref:G-protein coupled receptor 157-like n=1 Tax=Tubulanus polymorphus TaxID=672921 RepID=UPI003DA6B107
MIIVMNTTVEPEEPFGIPTYFAILVIVSCVFSIIGGAVIMLSYMCLPQIRTAARRLVVYLTVADLLTAIGNLVGMTRYVVLSNEGRIGCGKVDDLREICVVQSALTTYSAMCSLFWTVALAVYLYMNIACRDAWRARRSVLYCHIVSWGIPGVIVLTAAIGNVLGDDLSETTVGWCWISTCSGTRRRQVVWMLGTGKAWEPVAGILAIVFFVLVKCHSPMTPDRRYTIHLNRDDVGENADDEPEDGANKHLAIIPIVFIVLRMWGTIRFFLHVTDDNPLPRATDGFLLVLQGIGDSGQGFCNCIIFCLSSRKLNEYFSDWCTNCWCACKRCCPSICREYKDLEQFHKFMSSNRGYDRSQSSDYTSHRSMVVPTYQYGTMPPITELSSTPGDPSRRLSF